jgi:hypothetical protein
LTIAMMAANKKKEIKGGERGHGKEAGEGG